MLGKLLPRLSYANVTATLALFFAITGGAYAAATIGSSQIKDNAILSRHIKNGQVKGRDLAANSVGTGKVIDGSLLKQDFKAGQLPQGPQGLQGKQGLQGTAGPGAISIPITHVAAGDFGTLRTVHGVKVGYSCTYSSASQLKIDAVGGAYPTVYVSGVKAENGVLSAVNTSNLGIVASESTTNSFDVIATADGTWSRIDLGGYGGGGNNGCNVWGLIIPGT